MANTVPIAQTLKFHFGNNIFGTDGQAGILTHVLFDATTQRLTYLAVKQGKFFGKTHYLPFEAVSRATGDGIWLKSTLAEIEATPTSEGPGVALDTHTSVKGSSGTGTLTLLAVLPDSGELIYIVVHNLLPGHDTLLRGTYVTTIAPGELTVAAEPALLKSLPPYRPDRILQQEVEQIVLDLGFLRIDLKGMSLRVLDSVLYMRGNISSALRGELTRDQVSGVAGLLEIRNDLIGDDTLASDIALALGKDERTRDLPIGVYPQLGVVRLSGSVHNAAQKTAAGEIASRFDGVRDVINNLLIDPNAAMLYVMSAPEGGEAKDLVPGKFTRHTR